MDAGFAIVLFVGAILLFVAIRTRLIADATMQTLANVVTVVLFVGGILVVVLPQFSAPTVEIQGSESEAGGIDWQADFYRNVELKEPVAYAGKVTGTRNGLKIDWKTGQPNNQIPADYFSARFVASPQFNAGTYCFVIMADDGARLFVDGRETLTAWWGYTPGAVYRTPQKLEQGPHTIEFQFYEEFAGAAFHVYWYSPASAECKSAGHPNLP